MSGSAQHGIVAPKRPSTSLCQRRGGTRGTKPEESASTSLFTVRSASGTSGAFIGRPAGASSSNGVFNRCDEGLTQWTCRPNGARDSSARALSTEEIREIARRTPASPASE